MGTHLDRFGHFTQPQRLERVRGDAVIGLDPGALPLLMNPIAHPSQWNFTTSLSHNPQ